MSLVKVSNWILFILVILLAYVTASFILMDGKPLMKVPIHSKSLLDSKNRGLLIPTMEVACVTENDSLKRFLELTSPFVEQSCYLQQIGLFFNYRRCYSDGVLINFNSIPYEHDFNRNKFYKLYERNNEKDSSSASLRNFPIGLIGMNVDDAVCIQVYSKVSTNQIELLGEMDIFVCEKGM